MADEPAGLDASAIAQETYFLRSSDPAFLMRVTPEGRFVIVAVNPAHGRATGLPPDVSVGKDVEKLLPEGHAEPGLARLAKCAETGEEARFFDVMHVPRGRRVWLTRLVPLRGASGRVELIAGFGRDVTDEHESQARLRASEARYRNLLDTLHEGVWQVDAENRTAFVNPRVGEMLGYSVDELVGRELFEFFDEATAARVRQSLEAHRDGTPQMAELEMFRKDGSVLHALVSATAVFDAEGQYVGSLAALKDVTAVRTAEDERRALERKLQETQKLESLGVLAGGIAHDFNNILTGILGSVSLARMRPRDTERVERYLAHIETSAQRASELCRQMLAYAGKGRFVVRCIDLNREVRETAELVRASIDRRVRLHFDLAGDLLPIEADTTQLRQVLMNLVINASEALCDEAGREPGVITLATGVQTLDATASAAQGLPPGTYAFLRVVDNGPGMPPDMLAKIFDPFFSTKFTGRGLGLSAVVGIVRGHGGAVAVDSEPGKGTTFKLLFPVTTGSVDVSDAPPKLPSLSPLAGTVLVVDDEPTVRAVAKAILQELGLAVITACDGSEAVDRVRASPDAFSAVLMDLTMPNLDGIAAFTELRAIRPDLKIVLMSGHDEQDAVARFAGAGLAAFLQKPFTALSLRQKLEAVLD